MEVQSRLSGASELALYSSFYFKYAFVMYIQHEYYYITVIIIIIIIIGVQK